jgi:hypothetical protein
LVVAEALLTAVADGANAPRSKVKCTPPAYFAAGTLAQIAKSEPTAHLIDSAISALSGLSAR